MNRISGFMVFFARVPPMFRWWQGGKEPGPPFLMTSYLHRHGRFKASERTAEGMNSQAAQVTNSASWIKQRNSFPSLLCETSYLSLRIISGTEKQTNNSSGASFLFPFPFPALVFLCSWSLSALVPGMVCTMFSLICLALLSGSLTTKTKPNQI